MGAMRYLAMACLLMWCGVGFGQSSAAPTMGTGELAKARGFTPEQGTVRTMANGGQSRDILHAALATGEPVSIHESTQPVGAKPNPPHTIQHSEFILVREGTLLFEHDGVSEQAKPGSVIYVAYGTMHTVRNAGNTPAKYMVIAIGGDQKE
jgi:mannose-6-phosphate isomerase-like protein (cupin superfamily)